MQCVRSNIEKPASLWDVNVGVMARVFPICFLLASWVMPEAIPRVREKYRASHHHTLPNRLSLCFPFMSHVQMCLCALQSWDGGEIDTGEGIR